MLVAKLKQDYNRLEVLKEIRKAIELERSEDRRMQIIRNDTWKSRTPVVRDVMPGPGEYSPPEIGKGGGAAWEYKPKAC